MSQDCHARMEALEQPYEDWRADVLSAVRGYLRSAGYPAALEDGEIVWLAQTHVIIRRVDLLRAERGRS